MSVQQRPQFAKATGKMMLAPGVGPYLPQGAAKMIARRPMYRGGPPKKTGVFDAQSEFPPTKLSAMYDNGELPCRIDVKGSEESQLK